jgi:hypothetical protein
MFEYELHQMRSAELIRKAEDYRLGREARHLRRTARKTDTDPEGDAHAHTHDHRPPHVPRAA